MLKRDYYVTPDSNPIMRAFWKAAGGDRYLLERATYSDQVKYLCLGGIVVATGAMAGLAGGYAFYTIFSPKGSDAVDNIKTVAFNPDYVPVHIPTMLLSIVFGIIWGLIIFNIDRFIVTSTGKGDGTEAITAAELKGAIPRILMGAIIALTISKPIEIRMFQSEINGALQEYQDSVARSRSMESDRMFKNEIAPYEARLAPLTNLIQVKESRKAFLDSMVTYENTHGGCHGKCEENKLERDRIIGEIRDIKSSSEYRSVDSLIAAKTAELNSRKENIKIEKTGLNGLLIRMQLAHKIAGFWISLFITLLFMAIELTPVFFKLMLTKTPYDYLAENRDELIKAENGIEVRYDFYKDKTGLERHLVMHHESDRLVYEKIKVAEIQKELTDYAIEQYKNREKAKIDSNLDDYIKTLEPNGSIN
jgi:Domain of unknown function (DUF4407)